MNCLVTGPMVKRMDEFVTWLEQEGVDTLYVSLPWYLAPQAAARMDDYYRRHVGWAQVLPQPSWHSYSYRLSPELVPDLALVLEGLQRRSGRIKLRHNPELSAGELPDFIGGSDLPAQGKTRCQSIGTRMDVFPDGEVVSCKFFPEFRVGNLAHEAVETVWHGERYRHLRETVTRCGLMPVCAKCNLLYTRGG